MTESFKLKLVIALLAITSPYNINRIIAIYRAAPAKYHRMILDDLFTFTGSGLFWDAKEEGDKKLRKICRQIREWLPHNMDNDDLVYMKNNLNVANNVMEH